MVQVLLSLVFSRTGGCLKIIFFIFFILVNLGLLYSEYLDNKNKDNFDYVLKNGIGSELKKIGGAFLLVASTYSTYITIKNEPVEKSKVEEFKKSILDSREEVKKVKDVNSANNFIHKLHLNSIERSHQNLDNIRKEKSDLIKALDEKKVKFENGDISITPHPLKGRGGRLLEKMN